MDGVLSGPASERDVENALGGDGEGVREKENGAGELGAGPRRVA